MNIGETWLFFVPPGWIVGGTISEIKDGVLVLKDAAWLEACASGHALLSAIPRATSAKEMKAICPTSWGLPDGFRVRADAALMSAPCMASLRPLARAEDAAVIKGAR